MHTLSPQPAASLIQSTEELTSYLRTTPNSPLDRLSTAAKQRFVNSLVFTENGLGSYRYAELETLTATEIHEILSLFGAERTTSMIRKARILNDSDRALMQTTNLRPDHVDYWCSGRATCTKLGENICMSGC